MEGPKPKRISLVSSGFVLWRESEERRGVEGPNYRPNSSIDPSGRIWTIAIGCYCCCYFRRMETVPGGVLLGAVVVVVAES